jgi:ABC-type sulfate transport system permease component
MTESIWTAIRNSFLLVCFIAVLFTILLSVGVAYIIDMFKNKNKINK